MRVRCSKNDCPFDVPDDMIGARIRCPHCGHLMFVEAADTANEPSAAKKPAKKPAKLENQIYDGLPPLTVMMALRRQQANLPDLPSPVDMTDDDWKALAAYEQVLHAEQSLWTSLLYGLAALAFNLIVGSWVYARQYPGAAIMAVSLIVPTCIMLVPGLFHVWNARQRLGRLHIDMLVTALPFTVFCTAFVYCGYGAAFGTIMFNRDADFTFFAGLGILFNLVAAIDTSKAWLHLVRGLRLVEPSEILHRLTEALKYLPIGP